MTLILWRELSFYYYERTTLNILEHANKKSWVMTSAREKSALSYWKREASILVSNQICDHDLPNKDTGEDSQQKLSKSVGCGHTTTPIWIWYHSLILLQSHNGYSINFSFTNLNNSIVTTSGERVLFIKQTR